ncbi:hypothetical protein V5O48_010639 [Marasmius crinis-equi]|uniref:C2H2-type domain-containing protein n=1 Tax=Marasmius crinis-equi TaxID=585013 RepID=A0ABR3F882_9AGAR
MSRSWSGGMSKFLNLPDDLPCGDEDLHRSHSGSYHDHVEEPRCYPLGSVGRGILIEGSGEYVHPHNDWAPAQRKRHDVGGGHYYSNSTDSNSTTGTSPSLTATTAHTFLSSDARSVGSSSGSSDSDPSIVATPSKSDEFDSALAVQVFSSGSPHAPSPPFQPSQTSSRHGSPPSIYSSSLTSPSPGTTHYSTAQEEGLISPLHFHHHDGAGVTVNMSDVYSPIHQSQDAYSLPFPDSLQPVSAFDGHRFPRHTPPPHPPSPSFEAGFGGQFGYRSPLRDLDAELEGGLGKRMRMSSDSEDDFEGRKRARNCSPAATPAPEKRKRGRPRKSEQAQAPANTIASPPGGFSDSDAEYAEREDDADSDVYVPSDEEGTSRRRQRKGGRAEYGSKAGNAEALRAFETRSSVDLGTGFGLDHPGFSSFASHGQESLIRSSGAPRSHPVPVPHLTKKSRGRKVPVSGTEEQNEDAGYDFGDYAMDLAVPTVNLSVDVAAPRGRPTRTYHQDAPVWEIPGQPQTLDSLPPGVGANEAYKIVSGGIKKLTGERRYVCTADGCGKCFVRGEHLKRHVRSLHTWDKPHKCPHPGCGKSFSRRDNLGQHVRVHL